VTDSPSSLAHSSGAEEKTTEDMNEGALNLNILPDIQGFRNTIKASKSVFLAIAQIANAS
jgi:hypothetical protein